MSEGDDGTRFQLGILDLGPPEQAFLIATRAEALGYSRYWLPEHHGEHANCGSPTVMTALIAGMTETIRVGPAGILLTYSSPLKIAEDYRVLSLLFPGRIDLGVARAVSTGATHDALLDGRVQRSQDYDVRVETLARLVRDDMPAAPPALAPRVVPEQAKAVAVGLAPGVDQCFERGGDWDLRRPVGLVDGTRCRFAELPAWQHRFVPGEGRARGSRRLRDHRCPDGSASMCSRAHV